MSVNTQLAVTGMTCSHCVASVTEELSALNGVENVSIDLIVGGESVVTVESDAPLGENELQAAITEAGYTLVGASS